MFDISGTFGSVLNAFISEKAVSPIDASVSWVVVDSERYSLHAEATAFLAGLRALDRSPNTERCYAGRVALYLSYCAEVGMAWQQPGLHDLARFLRWLVREPLPSRGRKVPVRPRHRSEKTANAIMTTVCGFLRFGVTYGWVGAEVVALLSEPKYLGILPPGYQAGEDGQFRTVRAKAIKFNVHDDAYEWLAPQQVEVLVDAAGNERDRFLVAVMGETGMRIGEALGLRREDMHLLSNSEALGCRVVGPHLHVVRRRNANGALAKSRFPRSIPVTGRTVGLYSDYLFARERVPEAVETDAVFVNLYRAPRGRAMRYPNAKDMFDRLARRAGFTVRPHMLRHTAATAWIRSGVDPDVAQALLGQVSPSSMEPYLHATDTDKRSAVERVAALQGARG